MIYLLVSILVGSLGFSSLKITSNIVIVKRICRFGKAFEIARQVPSHFHKKREREVFFFSHRVMYRSRSSSIREIYHTATHLTKPVSFRFDLPRVMTCFSAHIKTKGDTTTVKRSKGDSELYLVPSGGLSNELRRRNSQLGNFRLNVRAFHASAGNDRANYNIPVIFLTCEIIARLSAGISLCLGFSLR